jgi:hypothetical protein
MTQDEGPVAHPIIRVSVSVDIKKSLASCRLCKEGIRLEKPDVVADPAGKYFGRPGVQPP